MADNLPIFKPPTSDIPPIPTISTATSIILINTLVLENLEN